MEDLVTLKIEKNYLILSTNVKVIALVALALLLTHLINKGVFKKKKDIEIDIKLAGLGTLKIKQNNQVQQIAHKAWVELKTRKAAIPIDKDNDIISDVYKSWYELFKEMRLLARDVPAKYLKDKDTQLLVDTLVDSLNNGLRPHLTLWRAKYERWYNKAVEMDQNVGLTPQDIQKKYPKFQELVDDMMELNHLLIDYAAQLKKLTR